MAVRRQGHRSPFRFSGRDRLQFAGCYANCVDDPIAAAPTLLVRTLGEILPGSSLDLILDTWSATSVQWGSPVIQRRMAAFVSTCRDKMGESVWAGGQWTGAYFNLPGFLIVFILTLLLVRGVKESAETNNIMVAIKIGPS